LKYKWTFYLARSPTRASRGVTLRTQWIVTSSRRLASTVLDDANNDEACSKEARKRHVWQQARERRVSLHEEALGPCGRRVTGTRGRRAGERHEWQVREAGSAVQCRQQCGRDHSQRVQIPHVFQQKTRRNRRPTSGSHSDRSAPMQLSNAYPPAQQFIALKV
jgi:hypothetical protein